MKINFAKSILTVLFLFFLSVRSTCAYEDRFWDVQSIDTMKYSRDLAREKLNDKGFEVVIDKQLNDISKTGATHVSIGTPYDEEFLPYLKTWVELARKNNLKVWFRGNLSGWEGWFNYPFIKKEEHARKMIQFIEDNSELFEDGDIFSSCPECENGVIGDPRTDINVEEFRKFLISEYLSVKKVFEKIGKQVSSNYYSMNADVAYLVMDEETTKALDGLVTVDHYVKEADSYPFDIERLVSKSGGKVVIGEFGAPIPDIHGYINEKDQSKWIYNAFSGMVNDSVVGVNYWTHTSSSTGIWTEAGRAKLAVGTVEAFYKPRKLNLRIENELGKAVEDAQVELDSKSFVASEEGKVSVLLYGEGQVVTISSDGYKTQTLNSRNLDEGQKVVLIKEKENIFFKIRKFFVRLFNN